MMTKRLKFEAWINEDSSGDPGHMTVVDMQTNFTYEFSMGAEKVEKESVTTKHSSTNELYTAQSRVLQLSQIDASQGYESRHFAIQTSKMRNGQLRFTGFDSIVVEVTDDEYSHIRTQAAVRLAAGTYNFLREMQIKNPLASRCLTFLEELAKCRKQKLITGKAFEVLEDFVKKNPTTVSEKKHVRW